MFLPVPGLNQAGTVRYKIDGKAASLKHTITCSYSTHSSLKCYCLLQSCYEVPGHSSPRPDQEHISFRSFCVHPLAHLLRARMWMSTGQAPGTLSLQGEGHRIRPYLPTAAAPPSSVPPHQGQGLKQMNIFGLYEMSSRVSKDPTYLKQEGSATYKNNKCVRTFQKLLS